MTASNQPAGAMPFRIDRADGIAELVIAHPPVNALDAQGWHALSRALDALGEDDDVRVIVVRGEGRGFCAGVDIKELAAHPERIVAVNAGNYETFRAVHRNPKPVIAAVHGFVLGGGIGICGAADIVVAADCARFGVPEIDRGAMGGGAHLQRLFGVQKVRAMYFTGDMIDAAEAYRLGAVEQVVTRDALRDAALAIARKIAAKVSGDGAAREGGAERRRGRRSRGQVPLGAGLHAAGVHDERLDGSACRVRREARRAFRCAGNRRGGTRMNLTYTPQQQAFRAEIREWLAAHVPRERLPSFDTEAGFAAHREWERTLHSGRWSMGTWPRELGGRGCDLIEWLIFEEEYWRADAPMRVNQNGIFLLGPTLMDFGTAEQKARFLPAMAAGEHVWAQGWSEPNAGRTWPRSARRPPASATNTC